MAQKLKAFKEDLKKWNKEEFGDLAFKKKSLLSELLGLDAKEDILGLSHEEQALPRKRLSRNKRPVLYL